jgi:hypothetical protein
MVGAAQNQRRAWRGLLALLVAALIAVPLLVAQAGAAGAFYGTPVTPSFGAAIEPLSSYEPPATCLSSVTPGVRTLQTLLARAYTWKTSFGTLRRCSGKATSEHNEGRALDWMLNASNANDVRLASTVLTWLLKTDTSGNQFANARRLGIMYIIWNRKMWRAYDASAGWRPYTGSVPHTDHIHFSLSWAGARGQDTWTFPSASAPQTCDAPTRSCLRPGDPDVYTTAGARVVGGREWVTSCVASTVTSTTRRCVTSLRGLVTTSVNGRYATSVGWLQHATTYVDTEQPAWHLNAAAAPLSGDAAGSVLRVVCSPDADSGPRTCHDYRWATTLVRTGTPTGFTYRTAIGWSYYQSVVLT